MDKKLANAFQELEKARQQLLEAIDGCDENQRYYKPLPHEWSMVQVVTHLATAEQKILSYMQDKIDKQAAFKTAGFAAWARTLVVKYALRYKKKIKAPAVVTTPVANMDYQKVKRDWEAGRQQFSHFLEKLPETAKHKEIFRHPMVGMMNIYQTLGFMREHVLHHIPQVKRLGASSKN